MGQLRASDLIRSFRLPLSNLLGVLFPTLESLASKQPSIMLGLWRRQPRIVLFSWMFLLVPMVSMIENQQCSAMAPSIMQPSLIRSYKEVLTLLKTLKEGFDYRINIRTSPGYASQGQNIWRDTGTDVSELSIPLYSESALIWMCALPIAAARQDLRANLTGRKQLFLIDRVESTNPDISSPKRHSTLLALGPKICIFATSSWTRNTVLFFHACTVNIFRYN